MFEQYQTTPSAGQRRAMGLNLVVFFLFALVAVALLTRTAVAANAINRDVKAAIVPVTADIDQNLQHLPILDETAQVTRQIAAAAKPLPGYTGKVADATTRIDKNLTSTGSHVTSIGKSVDAIKVSTGAIQPGIAQIGGTVDTIHGKATGIDGSLGSVAQLSGSIVANLTSAEAHLANVLGGTVPLHGATQGILASAGSIDKHAASIENSQLLTLTDSLLAPLVGVISPKLASAPSGAAAGGNGLAATTAPPTGLGTLPTVTSDPLGIVSLLGNLLGGI
jgi:hypothetical protein